MTSASGVSLPKNNRRRLLLRWLLIMMVIIAAAWMMWYFFDARWHESTDDAYVNGNIVQITPQLAGTVVAISADDGDLVKQGEVLVTLDRADADINLAKAKANLASTVRRVRGLYTHVASAQADVAQRKVALDMARADFKRRRGLAHSGAVSVEELAHAHDALVAAENAWIAAQQHYQTNKVLIDDTVVASHPEVQAAVAQLRAAYLEKARALIKAPVSGYVAQRTVQLGQRVPSGMPLMAVVPLHHVWVDANFKETQLTHMRIGQPVELTSDIYGDTVVYKGVIGSLGVGTGSAFSLLPAQNATGNWIKIVQRIPVRVLFTEPEQLDSHPLRIGLSMNVKVNLHDQHGPRLAQRVNPKPMLSTDIYRQQLATATDMIKEIIHANMAGDKQSSLRQSK